MEGPAPIIATKNEYFINKEIENKNEYIMNENEYKLLVYIKDKYIIFNVNKLENISLYYYQNKYELKEIINILNLNDNLYDKLEEIKELINKAYLSKKISIHNINNKINIILKLTNGLKDYESSIK